MSLRRANQPVQPFPSDTAASFFAFGANGCAVDIHAPESVLRKILFA